MYLLHLQINRSSYITGISFELVRGQDVYDDGQYGNDGDADRVQDHTLVRETAVPFRAVDTHTYSRTATIILIFIIIYNILQYK